MPYYEMDDKEFMGYVRLHSKTERALFSRKDAVRLLKLGRRPEPKLENIPSLVAIHYDSARELIEDATRNVMENSS